MLSNMGAGFVSVIGALMILLDNQAVAQSTNSSTYTVYSTFIFARTGERTPTILGGNNSVQLTAYGATQQYNLGQFYRNRYIGTGSQAPQRISGLSPYLVDDIQINVLSPATDYTTKSAQAFMQGFYPPYILRNANSSGGFDPLSVMANNSYIDWPNGGYQYPMIQTFSGWSPESIWINGQQSCTNSDLARQKFYNGQSYFSMSNTVQTLYSAISPLFTGTDTMPPANMWSYASGFSIYEFLDFENRHNTTVYNAFKEGGSYAGMLPALSQLADMKVWDLYGDQSPSGKNKGDAILTIAGQTLAAKILAHLQSNIYNLNLINKFNLVTGEYQPMISLMSLLGLGDLSSHFRTVPTYGSSMVFEVFAWRTDTNDSYIPSPDELWVRFLYRNGSNPMSDDQTQTSPDIQAYPIFRRGPSNTDMPWKDFVQAMTNISTSSVIDWCQTCQTDTIFCVPFLDGGSSNSNSKHGSSDISPAVGGVIGAIVTLIVAGLLAALAVFFCGIRFYRRENTKKSLGGFKGSDKMASDADLNLPKHSAPIGISFGHDDTDNDAAIAGAKAKRGHERVGSWELKPQDKEMGFGKHARFPSIASTAVGRPSLDEEDHDGVLSVPVSPRESI